MVTVEILGKQATFSRGTWLSEDALFSAKLMTMTKNILPTLSGYHPNLTYRIAQEIIELFGTGEIIHDEETDEYDPTRIY